MEFRVALRLLQSSPDLAEGLHAAASRDITTEPIKWKGHIESVDAAMVDELFQPFPRHANISADNKDIEEFSVTKRSEIPLSQHPKLRAKHPDYDPITTLDHDPAFMRREVRRWADEYMERERGELRSRLLGVSVEQMNSRFRTIEL